MAMPKSTRILARIFDRSTTPIYIVTPNQQLGYANEACAKWAGLSLDDLLNARCVYASSQPPSSGNDDQSIVKRIQGLAPDPRLMATHGSQETHQGPQKIDDSQQAYSEHSTVFATTEHDQKCWRYATMTPLFDLDQQAIGVLVVCGYQSFPTLPPNPETDLMLGQRQRLHLALAAIRTATDQIYSLESLVGTSVFANRMKRQVESAIKHNSDLLIVGRPGTGKEHLARTIHGTRDSQQESELIPVHCSITDQTLIHQHIKDIVSTRTDASNNDWLLLLDVDQLGGAAQHELLGFFELPNFPLQTIATSSENLVRLAHRGTFSTELAFYLSTFVIELPTLAERPQDIPLLAQALLERDNHRRDKQLSGFSNDVLQQLSEFNWPENIDQLNRIVLQASKNCRSTQIELSDLHEEFRNALSAMRIGTKTETEIDLDAYLGQIEKELIARAIKQAKGNKTKAAKLLSISRPKLLRRLQHFSLEEPAADVNNDQLDSSAFEELDR